MGKQIEITLEQLKNFLDQPYHNRFVMLESAVEPLNQSFNRNVFTSHDDTWKIESKKELQILIARGKSHTPAQPRKGKAYNKDYLHQKELMGETRPHVFMNYGFLHGTQIIFTGEKVELKTTPIIQRGFDYLSFHETHRSVLKLTFLRAWQKIIDKMINALIKEAKK